MKLNKKKVAVLGLAGLLALGGAGGALAYLIKDATSKSSSTAGDSAIIVSLGTTEATNLYALTIDSVETRKITANWAKSSSVVSGNIKVSFTLTGAYIITEIDTIAFDSGWTSTKSEGYYHKLSSDGAAETYTYTITASTGSQTSQDFYLRFTLDSSVASNTEVSGSLVCSVSYSAS